MSSIVNIFDMPAVQNIITCAETKIKNLTGADVKLLPSQSNGYLKDLQKEVLKSLVIDYTQVTWAQIISDSRKEEVLLARYIYVWYAVKKLGYSLSAIGRDISRGHDTIINTLNSIPNLKKKKQQWQDAFNEFDTIYSTKIKELNETKSQH